MKLLAFFFVFAIAFQIHAAEFKVATISTDTEEGSTVFYVETNNDNSIQGIRRVTTMTSGQITEDVHNSVEEILNGGVVLREMEGREIIRLYFENFNPLTGADVKLDYLYNGVTGSHGSQYIKLVNKAEGASLTDTEGAAINVLFVKGNWSRILRRWIGVSAIITSFEQKKK